MAAEITARTAQPKRIGSDAPFLAGLCVIGGLYIVLIVAMVLADTAFTSPRHLWQALGSAEIRYAIKLSLISCSIAALLSLWVAVPYAIPSVILAQFAVAAAFAVRTMRVTFDQINPRNEQVALTLGCTRSQAFWLVALPEARRGILTAVTLAWARSLGEFGPILIFSGATRMKTEVLSTTVFLELSVGHIEAAVAVSLLMIAAAIVVLV